MRPSKRAPDAMRAVTLERNVARYAEGSCLVKFGDTHVLCTASIEERVPPGCATGQGLGDGRIRHAAALDPHPHRARSGPRQAVRPHPGDPAPDRPLAARGRRPAGARRGARSTSTATCCRPTAARAPPRSPAPGSRCTLPRSLADAALEAHGHADDGPGRRRLLRHLQETPVLDLDYAEDFERRDRRQLRADRRRAASSRCRRTAEERAVQRGRSSWSCCGLAKKGVNELTHLQRQAHWPMTEA